MKKEEIVNRLTGLFDQGLDRIQEARGEVEEHFRTGTKAVTKRAKTGWNEGKGRFLATEQRLAGTLKQHPTVFILAGLGVLGLVFAKLLYDARTRANS